MLFYPFHGPSFLRSLQFLEKVVRAGFLIGVIFTSLFLFPFFQPLTSIISNNSQSQDSILQPITITETSDPGSQNTLVPTGDTVQNGSEDILVFANPTSLLETTDTNSFLQSNPYNSPPGVSKTFESGSGNSTLIHANETLSLTNLESLNTSNTFTQSTHDDFVQLVSLNGYTNQSGTFDIENLTAAYDHQIVEDSVQYNQSIKSGPGNNKPRAIATSFEIGADLVNITQLRLFFERDTGATGEAYISGVANGEPNGTVYGETLALTAGSAVEWTLLNYSTPVSLPKGTYAVILNETSIQDTTVFIWYYVNDTSTPMGDGVSYRFEISKQN